VKIKLPNQLRKVSDTKLLSELERDMEKVELGIQESTKHTESMIDKMSSHLASAGGKRMRPVLVLLTSRLGSGANQDVIDAAVVMEITHLGTLYHDDVMDQAPRRRGVDTAHTIWGNNVAILTGDLLFARASNLVSGLGEEALKLQAQVFEQLVLGQLHETLGPSESQEPLEHYISVLRDKTGSLIALSARLGALLSGADRAFQEPLQLFGERIGIAFQLMDDIIDIQSDKEKSGKTPGTDLLAGVPTMPTLMLRGFEDAESRALSQQIESGLTPENLAEVVSKLRVHPVMQQAYAATKKWSDDAISAIDSLPEGSVKAALIAFAQAVVEREG
jgi:heptaprenyl diphosphate synthase